MSCLKYSVRLIVTVVIGTVKATLIKAPLYRAYTPSFFQIKYSPWKALRYPKIEPYREAPEIPYFFLVATSALCICILNFTSSRGVTKYPAMEDAPAEHIIAYFIVGLPCF
jgi:hypothetical protein